MARIRVQHLRRRYHDFELGPMTLDLPDRSFTVLLGPSGSGKSTLLRLLAGLELPDEGRLHLDERDVTTVGAEARGVGLVFQDGALFPHLTVTQNVAFGLRVQGVPRRERQERAEELLDLVGLPGKGARRVARLSGGERQRVALARALAPRPRVMLFDEPLASLDRNLREELRDALRRIHDELHLTSVLVTHDREEALALADRLVVLRDGRLVEQGSPKELFERPQSAFAARFLGAANVIPSAEGALLVRPDEIHVEAGEPGNAHVREIHFLGFHEEATLVTDEGVEIRARAEVGRLPPRGARVRVSFDSDKARRVAPENRDSASH